MTHPTDPLLALSIRIAEAVAAAERHVVRVDGRRRAPASGVAVAQDLVVTTHHALEREDEVAIGLPDGATSAVAEGAALAPGQLVLSVSRPGRTARAALGVVARAAGEWRGPSGGKIDRWLETTLDLHPGLSGGLALSAAGAPAGVVTSGLVRGAAMILPAETVRRVVDALAAHGSVRRGYLGVATFPVRLPPPVATAAGQHGALLVSAVEPGSPAAEAGLLLGDAVLTLGGEEVSDFGDLLPLLEPERIGKPLPVKVLRAGEVRELSVTVGTRERRSA